MERSEMSAWDLEGWKEIASFIGKNPRTAMRYELDTKDPLPVYRWRGHVFATSAEVRAWFERQTRVPS